MNLPLDLKRVAQVNAKIYLKDRKQFGNISYYGDDMVKVNVGTSKEPYYIDYSTADFHAKLINEEVVAKSRVTMKDDDSMRVTIRPRVIMAEPETSSVQDLKPITTYGPPMTMDLPLFPGPHIPKPFQPKQELLTGYIDEKSGKFSATLQSGMIEIKYHKVTRKVELELDSVQLAKLKELGII